MTPINMELYDAVELQYGTTAETTAYTGPFMLAYYEADQVLDLKENPNFHSPERYFFTGVQFQIIADATVRFQAFMNDDLDAVGVPGENFEDVAGDPRLRQVPGPTTFRIMINMLGTPEAQEEMFGNSDLHTPEPILANQHFRTAMYFAIDRAELAFEVLRTSAPQQFLYTEAYLVEPLSGIAFRNTEQGEAVGEGLSAETYGFNPDAAVAFWVAALDELVADGVYDNGDVIELELLIFSGSEAQVLFGNFIKEAFETAFDGTQQNISFVVNVEPRPFPGIYFDFMMIGEFDLSIGGISGSTLDAASFLDVYIDDNRGGFTLNWGVDTSTPAIEVTFPHPTSSDPDDRSTWVTETWSFNALVRSLNGTVTIQDGYEYE